MSSLVAGKPTLPATGDVADTDDGNTTVDAGDFWPVIKLRDLRLASRITGGITTSRLLHVTTGAVAHVIMQLQGWKATQESQGYTSLQAVPADQINGESMKVYHFRRAVYAIARASILEGYRDVDTTAKGDKDASALDLQRDDLWRDAHWSISDIKGEQRIYAELC